MDPLLLVIIAASGAPDPAPPAPVAFDVRQAWTMAAGTAPTTWTGQDVTYSASANLAVVAVSNEGDAISGVTLGGVAMTKVATSETNVTGNRTTFWFLLAASLPAGGTARSVVVAQTGGSGNTGGYAHFWSFVGAKQQAPICAVGTATSGAVVTASLTGVEEDSLLLACANFNQSTQPTSLSWNANWDERVDNGSIGSSRAGMADQGPVSADDYDATCTGNSAGSPARLAVAIAEIQTA